MNKECTILAVEDSTAFVEHLRAIFKRSRIDQAPALALALDRLHTRHYDLVILDLELLDARPEQTIEAIPEVKQLAEPGKLIVLSGWECYAADVARREVEFIGKGDAHRLLDVIDAISSDTPANAGFVLAPCV